MVSSLLDKLCFTAGEIFSLVLEHVKSLKRNKLTLLDPEDFLAKVCRVTFYYFLLFLSLCAFTNTHTTYVCTSLMCFHSYTHKRYNFITFFVVNTRLHLGQEHTNCVASFGLLLCQFLPLSWLKRT